MLLLQIIEIFIFGGFFVILAAPLMKLFKKTGKPSWLALVPGANVYTSIYRTGKPVMFASAISIVAFIAFLIFRGALVFQGGVFDYMLTVLLLLVIFGLFCLIHLFPMMSSCMFLAVAVFGPASGTYKDDALIAALILLILGAVQVVWDVIGWISLLRGLKKPLWQVVFPLLPLAAGLLNAAVVLFAGFVDFTLILATFIPPLFIGLFYFYYLGYSGKVIYREPQK